MQESRKQLNEQLQQHNIITQIKCGYAMLDNVHTRYCWFLNLCENNAMNFRAVYLLWDYSLYKENKTILLILWSFSTNIDYTYCSEIKAIIVSHGIRNYFAVVSELNTPLYYKEETLLCTRIWRELRQGAPTRAHTGTDATGALKMLNKWQNWAFEHVVNLHGAMVIYTRRGHKSKRELDLSREPKLISYTSFIR